MKITLILAAPPDDALFKLDPFMPLSLPLLAGSAPEHEYTFVDMLKNKDAIDYDAPVDLVGISVRMTAEKTAYDIAKKFQKKNIKVILGGPQISAVPYRAIQHADSVVVGEGEALWPVIIDDHKKGNLKNFYVCSPKPFDPGDKTLFQQDKFPDLIDMPFPNRNLFKDKYRFYTVFASRGCPIDCDFCSVPSMFGKKMRLRPVEHVIEEISRQKGFYYLIDDTVFGRPSTYDYYLELYRKLSEIKNHELWTGQANLDAVESSKGREVIRMAVKAGLVYAAVGIESINPEVIRKTGVGRKMGLLEPDDVILKTKEHISFLQDLGIIVSGWFVLGYEEDTIETYYKTYSFCEEMNILPIISPVNALPGTRLYKRLIAEGKLDNSNSLTNLPHPTITKAEVIKALRLGVREGFSIQRNLKRTRFYQERITKENGNSPKDKIKKTIFSMILQANMPKILNREIKNLASSKSQNYFE